jgi:hypothetical protein
LRAQALQEQAWLIVHHYYEHGRTVALEGYGETASRGLATTDVKQAVLAAYDGRVSILFVALGIQQWGTFDAEKRKVHLYDESKPGTKDLLDFAAVQTLTKDGMVYAVEQEIIPSKASLAAILRY